MRVRKKFKARPFIQQADDPLNPDHEIVLRWVADWVKSNNGYGWRQAGDLKSKPSGKIILDAKHSEARRLVMAAVRQTHHWDDEIERVRSQGKTESERINIHGLPGWDYVWPRRDATSEVISSLMRRSLPFESGDLIQIIDWCCDADNLNSYWYPLGYICRAMNRFNDNNDIPPELNQALRRFSEKLRGSYDKKATKLATTILPIIHEDGSIENQPGTDPTEDCRPVQLAAAGNPAVLDQLKRYFGLIERSDIITEIVGHDEFALRADSPLKNEHALLTKLFSKVVGRAGYNNPILKSLDAGREILAMDPRKRGLVLLAAAERSVHGTLTPTLNLLNEYRNWQARDAASGTLTALFHHPFEFDRQSLFDFLLIYSSRPLYARPDIPAMKVTDWVEEKVSGAALEEGERYVLYLFRASIIGGPLLGSPTDDVKRLTRMIGDGARFFLVPGEAWADTLNSDLGKLTMEERRGWSDLLLHLLSAKSARPSKKWLNAAEKSIESVGADKVRAMAIRLFELVDKGRTIPSVPEGSWDSRGGGDTMHEENALCLRGFLWIVPLLDPQIDLIRLVGAVAVSAYRKVRGVGPRAVKVGNAAVNTLSEIEGMDSVAQLAMLQAKVKFGTAQKMIEKAFVVAAEREGMPRDEIDELAVPEYGMTEVGKRIEALGDFSAELTTDGLTTELRWMKADGKTQKSVPNLVKKEFGDELKELKAAGKDIQSMLSAQKERLDQLFLKRKSWGYAVWRERYLDHALVGVLARRLFWEIDEGDKKRTVIWKDGALVDPEGKVLEVGDRDAVVALWHPFGRLTEQILDCRRFLEENRIRQPFKQAHREIYLLTDAERNTDVYSNRFAAHIIKQHQFNALCGQRGWKNTLQLMVDDAFPPARKLIPEYRIRAEFWASGIGDDYGEDTNESGTYWRMATDQVRFYPIDQPLGAGGMCYGENFGHETAEPLRLEEVPGPVFSEVMRDVDLFVGVCSVGADPAWADGGPEGRHRDYWHDYSFGDLSETAKTRREVLEGLVPQLKIAERCSLTEKFLVVRGDVRTYKIHLGSGNILMEPNDQYLCIIAGQSQADKGASKVFLPFEGDGMMAIILSKAMLLAEDRKIKDRTILSQIRMK